MELPAAMTNVEAALQYVSLGHLVIPLHTASTAVDCSCGAATACQTPGSHPRAEGATDKPEVVSQWWAQWPDANIGIMTGAKSNLVALWVTGDLSERLPNASRVEYANGATLFLFQAPENVGSNQTIRPGVDFIGEGGLLNAPQSFAPATTHIPEWVATHVVPKPPKPTELRERALTGVLPEQIIAWNTSPYWVAFRLKPKWNQQKGRWGQNKIPVGGIYDGAKPYPAAVAALRNDPTLDGIGKVFSEHERYFFFDLDDCKRPDGTWAQEANDLVARLPGCAVAISQSGTGLHIFGSYAEPFEHGCKAPGIEFYTEGHFVANTMLFFEGGNVVTMAQDELVQIAKEKGLWGPQITSTTQDASAEWEDVALPGYKEIGTDAEVVAKLCNEGLGIRNALAGKHTVAQLYHADEAALDFYPSRSEAVFALLGKLYFYTGGNRIRMLRLFLESPLGESEIARQDDGEVTRKASISINTLYQQRDSVYEGVRATAPIPMVRDSSGGYAPSPTGEPPPLAVASTGDFQFNLRVNTDRDVALQIPAAGTHLKTTYRIEHSADGQLYRYDGGRYRPDGENFVAQWLREYLENLFRQKHVKEMEVWLRSHEPKITERPPEQLINCKNGLLEWRDLVLHPHSPEYFSRVQIPVEYHSNAVCPVIDRTLKELLPDELIPVLHEIAGLCLYAGNPFRTAVMLLGSGRNGKSTVLNLIQAIVGKENCAAIPLQTLAEDRFAAANLFGKLANIAGDLDARSIKRTDAFKTILGGDQLWAQHKHRDPFEFVPYATLLFSANEPPLSRDQTQAWFDRWLIFPFEKRLSDDEVDPHLQAKLHSESELQGFLVHAVAGLRRLMERGRFEKPAAIQAAVDEYRLRLDSVLAFTGEECDVGDSNAWTSRKMLYSSYRQYCEINGRGVLSSGQMYSHLRQHFAGRVVDKSHGKERGFGGIQMRSSSVFGSLVIPS